jgi:hypothetical protein
MKRRFLKRSFGKEKKQKEENNKNEEKYEKVIFNSNR